MRAGELRHRVVIEENRPSRNALGEEISNWVAVDTVWADVKTVSGREYVINERAQAEVSHKVKMRYRPDLTPSMRLRWGSLALEIEVILDPSGRQREAIVMARVAVPEEAA